MRKTQWSSTVSRLSKSSLASSGQENKRIFRSFILTFKSLDFFSFTRLKLRVFQQSAPGITVNVESNFTTMQHVGY